MNDIKAIHSENREIYCNCCGKKILETTLKNMHMDHLHIEKNWGYFSSKDSTKHVFNICEMCYDKWIAKFSIPVEQFPVEDIRVYTEEEMEILRLAYEEAAIGQD